MPPKSYIINEPYGVVLIIAPYNYPFQLRNVSINDTVSHIANPNIPFGGVGASGVGSYHGKDSFNTFSHRRGILKKHHKVAVPLSYPPHNDSKIKFIKLFLK